MDLKELSGYLFQPGLRDLLRVESLAWYDSAADDPHFARFTAGEPPQIDEAWRGWLDRIASDRADGMVRRRVHVIASDAPLTDYLRFELGVQYPLNAAAGERIRILEVGQAQLLGREYRDFWVADDRVAIMEYDRDGKFRRADPAGRDASYWALHAAHLWAEAAPFEEWWADYQQHRKVA